MEYDDHGMVEKVVIVVVFEKHLQNSCNKFVISVGISFCATCVVKECNNISSSTRMYSKDKCTPSIKALLNCCLCAGLILGAIKPRRTRRLPCTLNSIVSLSKFHKISPNVMSHSIPNTKSQHPKGRRSISTIKVVC